MGDYKFKITIDFDMIDDLVTEEKTCIYLLTEVKEDKTSDDKEKSIKEHKDNIHFSKNKIIISGTRTKKIIPSDRFYTVQSNFYRESVKALLYVYYKYGPFNLKSITFESEGETERVELIKPEMFSLTKQVQLDEQILDYLFEYSDKGDLITRVLMFMLLAESGSNPQFEYYWRSVNAIYNWKFPEIKARDTESVEKLLDYIKENKDDFTSSFMAVEEFFDQEFERTRAFRMMGDRINYGNRNFGGELESFRRLYLEKSYQNKKVVSLLLEFFKSVFSKHEEELQRKKRLFDDYLSVRGELENIEQNDDVFDLLRFTIWLIYYFRNKHFHGEMWPNNFLVSNFPSQELESFSKILRVIANNLLISLFIDE